MKMQSFRPHPSVAAFISDIVVLHDGQLANDMVLPLIAKGLPSIVFQTTDHHTAGGIPNRINNLVLYGQNIRPFNLLISGHLTVIAYFLHPHLLHTFFGFHAADVKDMSIDLSGLAPARQLSLKEQLLNEHSLEKRLALLDAFVLKLSERRYLDVNPAIHFATQIIKRSNGLVPLAQIQTEMSISERTFQRLFETHVGLAPKVFSKVCQFHNAFQQIRQKKFTRLSDVAYENGYADQSHLGRVFREFTNLSPKEVASVFWRQ
ncbi:helix-turn-helix domain-containing protein [Chryseolinea lacunae]|uniref:AraC family transcriptional regulator n=1 Tax=Chryseolinea lacunae TaxID=2801331 RepID=A0ABS1L2E1_9BACT|nr:helix-turn-helix domain-containing protein [Chryseolinea lacunae]MBL0745618.1 AraC family transcriptional regulator [Chryseolinea lacunae]